MLPPIMLYHDILLEIRLNIFRRSTIPQKQFIIIIIFCKSFTNLPLLLHPPPLTYDNHPNVSVYLSKINCKVKENFEYNVRAYTRNIYNSVCRCRVSVFVRFFERLQSGIEKFEPNSFILLILGLGIKGLSNLNRSPERINIFAKISVVDV